MNEIIRARRTPAGIKRDRRYASVWRRLLTAAIGLGACSLALGQTPATAPTPSGIDRITYFDADIRDGEFCKVTVDAAGKVSFGKGVTNPAMTCPDAYSWFLFVNVVAEEFWTRWAGEVQNWPEEPWPLCSSTSATQCCDPNRPVNDKDHCPVFPGRSFADKLMQMQPLLADSQPTLKASAEQKAVSQFLEQAPELVRVGSARRHAGATPALSLKDVAGVPECSAAQLDSVLPQDPQSIGRVLRQTNSEQTTRNESFHRYLFSNNLYNANGVLQVFANNDANQRSNAPYHLPNLSAGAGTPRAANALYTVDLPPDAIMIKANWVSERLVDAIRKRYPAAMTRFGTREDYIRHPMETQVGLADGSKCLLKGEHYLMAFHVSSKDIPQWLWTTFEHKNNPGRCDYTGCNDSFGYRVANGANGANGANAIGNFIAPNQHSDQLAASSIVFDPDLQYPAGTVNDALTRLFASRGIAKDSWSGPFANPGDAAWKNYRLKGSQTEFTDRQGRATHLGNSITEAGFMGQSSCIGCHARAGVAPAAGAPPAQFLRLGVFEPVLSEFGYQQSHMGVPNHAWFYTDNSFGSQMYNLSVLQTDFIWGFLNAQMLVTGDKSN